MAQHEMPAVPGVPPADPADPAPPTPPTSRWAISRGTLMVLLAVLLPAAASLLAAVITTDIAYHLRSGQIMLESGALLQEDRFTFTALGDPWLNQQWAASVGFAAVYDAAGWLGLLILRSVLIGAAFGLVYLACRGTGASRMVASLVTLGAFVVAATNLALRSQLLGVLFFAALMAIIVWRRRHPWLLLLVPLLMIAWANTHGSFFIGWAAIALAALEDLLARRRMALLTVAVGVMSVLATLVNPWGIEMWAYVLELSSNPVVAALVSEWQAPTLGTRDRHLLLPLGRPGGGAAAPTRARHQLATVALAQRPHPAQPHGLAQRGLVGHRCRAGGGVAPRWLGAPRAPPGRSSRRRTSRRGLWRHRHAAGGPDRAGRAVLPRRAIRSTDLRASWILAPRGPTEQLLADARPGDRLFADQRWGSWFELAVPDVLVMVDTRIELFDEQVWSDYLAISSGRADWSDILDTWEVDFVALDPGNQDLTPFITADPGWELSFDSDEGLIFVRAE